MAIPDSVKTQLCASWTDYDYIAVFTGLAGTNGANEATGGSYARVQTTYTSDSKGKNTSAEKNIKVAAGTYKEAGVFDAATTGNFGGSGAFNGGDVTVSGSGASIDVVITLQVN